MTLIDQMLKDIARIELFSIKENETWLIDPTLLADEDETSVKTLFSLQNSKSFYIPTMKEIEEISQFGYAKSNPFYQKLTDFFIKSLHQSEEFAQTQCEIIWLVSGDINGRPSVVFEFLNQAGIVFDSDSQMGEFTAVLMDVMNHTRMPINRGHMPGELSHQKKIFSETVIKKPKTPRNAPCPCGSGKKYKNCCGK